MVSWDLIFLRGLKRWKEKQESCSFCFFSSCLPSFIPSDKVSPPGQLTIIISAHLLTSRSGVDANLFRHILEEADALGANCLLVVSDRELLLYKLIFPQSMKLTFFTPSHLWQGGHYGGLASSHCLVDFSRCVKVDGEKHS